MLTNCLSFFWSRFSVACVLSSNRQEESLSFVVQNIYMSSDWPGFLLVFLFPPTFTVSRKLPCCKVSLFKLLFTTWVSSDRTIALSCYVSKSNEKPR